MFSVIDNKLLLTNLDLKIHRKYIFLIFLKCSGHIKDMNIGHFIENNFRKFPYSLIYQCNFHTMTIFPLKIVNFLK